MTRKPLVLITLGSGGGVACWVHWGQMPPGFNASNRPIDRTLWLEGILLWQSRRNLERPSEFRPYELEDRRRVRAGVEDIDRFHGVPNRVVDHRPGGRDTPELTGPDEFELLPIRAPAVRTERPQTQGDQALTNRARRRPRIYATKQPVSTILRHYGVANLAEGGLTNRHWASSGFIAISPAK